jgi:predicted ABC-type ATPase
MSDKRLLIIAGPNGAGKTTFAQEFLPGEAECLHFVNADLIAAGLSPFSPEAAAVQAGRIMLAQIHQHVLREEGFAFETTLSGRIYSRLIPEWQGRGYTIKLFFLQLPTPEMAIARVRQRVAAGGHNVPEGVIRRRFAAGLANFNQLTSRWWTSGFCTTIQVTSHCGWQKDSRHERREQKNPNAGKGPGSGQLRKGASPGGKARARTCAPVVRLRRGFPQRQNCGRLGR